jgi:hypothetical protein
MPVTRVTNLARHIAIHDQCSGISPESALAHIDTLDGRQQTKSPFVRQHRAHLR